MNKIEQLHLEAIQNSNSESYYPEYMVYFSEETAASKSAEITEQIAIEFAEWLIKELILSSHGKYLSHTPKELFQEFVKNKKDE